MGVKRVINGVHVVPMGMSTAQACVVWLLRSSGPIQWIFAIAGAAEPNRRTILARLHSRAGCIMDAGRMASRRAWGGYW